MAVGATALGFAVPRPQGFRHFQLEAPGRDDKEGAKHGFEAEVLRKECSLKNVALTRFVRMFHGLYIFIYVYICL